MATEANPSAISGINWTAPLSLAVWARIRDVPWILLSTSIAFTTVKLTGFYLGPPAATWSAALAVGLFSNLFARLRNRPVAIMLMPGLLLLVPGSLGFFGLSEIMVNDDLVNGMKIVSTMMFVAVSIVAGLLISNALFPIERPKHRYEVPLANRGDSDDVKSVKPLRP